MAKRAICDNPDHRGRPAAIARVSWPDGRFNPSLACATCVRWLIFAYVRGAEGEKHPMLIEPVSDG